MKLHYLFIFLSSFISIDTNAQKSPQQIDERLQEITIISGENLSPYLDEVKSLYNISQKQGYTDGMIISGRILMINDNRKNDYEAVINTADKIKTLKPVTDKTTIAFSDIYRISGMAKAYLGYNEIAFQEIKKAGEFAKKIKSHNQRHYKVSSFYENLTVCYENVNGKEDSIAYYLKKSIEEAKLIRDDNEGIPVMYKYDLIANNYNMLGDFYRMMAKPKDFKKAEEYYKACAELNEQYEILLPNRIFALLSLGEFYYDDARYNDAVEKLEKCLALEKRAKDPGSRQLAFEILAKSYLELGENEKSKKFLHSYTTLRDSIELAQKQSVNKITKSISSEKEKKHKQSVNNILLAGIALFCISIITVFLFWRRHNKNIHNKYNKLILRIEAENKFNNDFSLEEDKMALLNEAETGTSDFESDAETKKEANYSNDKSANITDATLNSILAKLEKFEKSKKYIKNEVSLTWLATFAGTNTKYLSEILNQNKGKTLSAYINGLRIEYIINLLYNEPKYRSYKISYLGKLCGFSSREVFSVVFKKETGITPSYFIENLKKKES